MPNTLNRVSSASESHGKLPDQSSGATEDALIVVFLDNLDASSKAFNCDWRSYNSSWQSSNVLICPGKHEFQKCKSTQYHSTHVTKNLVGPQNMVATT
jgi:hypothetical protein